MDWSENSFTKSVEPLIEWIIGFYLNTVINVPRIE